MERTTISTDLLIQKLTDNELVAIIKYQSLWAMLERQPDDKTALRYMTQKQLIIAKSWADSIEMFVTSDINSINKKRTRQKKSYEKQRVVENSDAANKGTVINRINVKKNNKKKFYNSSKFGGLNIQTKNPNRTHNGFLKSCLQPRGFPLTSFLPELKRMLSIVDRKRLTRTTSNILQHGSIRDAGRMSMHFPIMQTMMIFTVDWRLCNE